MAKTRIALENGDPPLSWELPQISVKARLAQVAPLRIGEDQYKPSERAGAGARQT